MTLSPESLPAEVTVEFASKYLGVTERMVTNYLKSNQLSGTKVGTKWFIDSESLKARRPQGAPLQDVQLPLLENPLSKNQEMRRKGRGSEPVKNWRFKQEIKRHPGKISGYKLLEESFQLLRTLREEIDEDDFLFFEEELLLLGDDLSAGYYGFGASKKELYGRARMRAGRLVSRARLYRMPEGFLLSLCAVVESVSFLCRRMDKPRGTR